MQSMASLNVVCVTRFLEYCPFHSDKHGVRSEQIQEVHFFNSRKLRGERFHLKPVRCCSISAFYALNTWKFISRHIGSLLSKAPKL